MQSISLDAPTRAFASEAATTTGAHLLGTLGLTGSPYTGAGVGVAIIDSGLYPSPALQPRIRESDFCARYAGDEFLVVLAGCDRDEAEARARHLQDAVAAAVVPDGDGAPLPIRLGISVGVGMCPDDGTTIPVLVAAADRRMYRNKASRRTEGTAGAPRQPECVLA